MGNTKTQTIIISKNEYEGERNTECALKYLLYSPEDEYHLTASIKNGSKWSQNEQEIKLVLLLMNL